MIVPNVSTVHTLRKTIQNSNIWESNFAMENHQVEVSLVDVVVLKDILGLFVTSVEMTSVTRIA